MIQAQKTRSGRIFFFVCLLLICAGIVTTFLLANKERNLDLVLKWIGYSAPVVARAVPETRSPVVAIPVVTIRRGNRLLPERMVVPAYAFADMKSPLQSFLREIRSDPRALCERLKTAGFAGMVWTTRNAGTVGWQCSSIVAVATEVTPDAPQSSVFVSIKGDGENRVTSFRIKLNIENADDRAGAIELAAVAASIFLGQVRWDDADAVLARIKALEEFDVSNFGSRIQFKREFGEPPRYNFLASQSVNRGAKSHAELYFDRSLWLPLTDSDGLLTIKGMMAGQAIGGMPLPENTTPERSQ